MCVHNHFAMKHSNADTLFLGCLKRSKERLTDEFLTHAATIVFNREHRPPIPQRRIYLNLTCFPSRIPRVEEQIYHHLLNLVGIDENFRQISKAGYQF